MAAAVTIVNLERLKGKLAALPEAYRRATRIEIKSALLNIQNGARRRARVRFGRMRNSITHEVESGGMSGVAGSNLGQSGKGNDILFHEFGTRFMRAQPMLFPAFEEERGPFVGRLTRALEKVGRDRAAGR